MAAPGGRGPAALVSQRLLGRVILVTGASSGIGAAAVRRFAAEGARAALFLLSDESRWTTGTVFPCEGGITAH
jgi:FlaA1/EpsC-like NDP-sugar epimerase